MPRAPRIYLENCLYYVTSVSSEGDGQQLFYDQRDYEGYLHLLEKYKKEYGFKLFAFALLPTRLHLVVELRNNVTISTIMHALNSLYTKIYNARYGKKGHLFQERFRSVLVDKDSYLVRLTSHVHALPVRAGLAEDPFEYAHTSFASYLRKGHGGTLRLNEETEELFEHLSGDEKVQGYENYVASLARNEREWSSFERLIGRKRVVGSQAFVTHVRAKIAKEMGRKIPALKVRRPLRRAPVLVAGVGAFLLMGGVAGAVLWHTLPAFRSAFVAQSGAEPIVLSAAEVGERLAQMSHEDLEAYNLDSSVWDIKMVLLHAKPGIPRSVITDRLQFKNQVIVSSNFASTGFGPSHYTVWRQGPDVTAWESTQQSKKGDTVRWYGEWNGRQLKGFMTQHAVEGISREFSFTGVRVQG